ncbi:sensor histidine kinase [Ralstonia flaminis]|jgi:two-component system OmpR family sensor kinase|uniref:histidine kinase n=1 Tax=Ralstonia flaminis TaxID=3058597 RepID=A0ABN9JLA6_9RALS|nr:ATP-binding protein [Ralstonia sp. LMG 18101]CAJ0812466.1 Adaptive-response sensory-kinase SasA [Ralstonia sp. LMG 18101]
MFSFQRRLILAHWAVILIVVTGVAFAAWWELSRIAHRQLDAALLALAETEAGMLLGSKDQPIRVHEKPAGTAPPSLVRLDRLVQIVDAQGDVLARSANLGTTRLPTSPTLLSRLTQGETVFETLQDFSEEPLRMVSLPVLTGGASPRVIQVAGSLDDVNRLLDSAVVLFVGLAIALLLAVGTAGSMLTRRVFRAIDNVVKQARRIGDNNLDERLPHPGTSDDIGKLVDTLNDMLDRLEHGFDMQRRFTADASHELRSPLSRLRTELEVTLRRERSREEYVETLHSCVEEVGRLTQMVEELLMLARLDAGQDQGMQEVVPVVELVQACVKRIAPAAQDRGIVLATQAGTNQPIRIARAPATLALSNLLDNAVKFSPAGTTVEIAWSAEHGDAILQVSDHGPGIPPAELPHIFERFYRGARARASETPGTGLGLALSQAIVQAHGGRIDAANAQEGGVIFRISLPRIT